MCERHTWESLSRSWVLEEETQGDEKREAGIKGEKNVGVFCFHGRNERSETEVCKSLRRQRAETPELTVLPSVSGRVIYSYLRAGLYLQVFKDSL